VSLARYAAKRDAVEAELVDALQRLGWSVLKVSESGAPDLVAFRRSEARLLECKSARGRLTPQQVQWRQTWTGPAPVTIRTLADVEALR